MTDTVEEAAQLLRRGRDEKIVQIGRLESEVAKIDAALAALANSVIPRPASPPRSDDLFGIPGASQTTRRRRLKAGGPSVKGAVLAALESSERRWSNAELLKVLEADGYSFATKDPKSPIRNALWTLRQDGLADTDSEGRSMATKWHARSNAESPAEAGLSNGSHLATPAEPGADTTEGGDGTHGDRDCDRHPAALTG